MNPEGQGSSTLSLPPLEQEVRVAFRYPVRFTHGLLRLDNAVLRDAVAQEIDRPLLFVIDDGVVEHHPKLLGDIRAYADRHGLILAGDPLIVPGGEVSKNDPAVVESVRTAIDARGVCRHSHVVAVGGGAVIDMAGFAAATAHRGVRLVRVPTTVLAQNDSAVGVKNGVNAFGKKNSLGSFAPPAAVLCDSHFLTTLSDRDWRAGISEAIKVALVKDGDFFAWLEAHADDLRRRDGEAMQRLIHRCAELHLDHIANSGDAFEQGSSRPLDFGHWAAHKLEQLSDYQLRHGEAVAVGIAIDATYSVLTGRLPEADRRRIVSLLLRLGLPVHTPELELEQDGRRAFLAGRDEFREHLGGRLTVMLLTGLGRGIEVHELADREILEAVDMLSLETEEGSDDLAAGHVSAHPA